MANDNETVEQLCADIKTRIEELWEQDLGAMLNGEVDEFADRIIDAHKRETSDLRCRLKVVEDALGESRIAICHICNMKHTCGHGTAKFDPCCIIKDIDSALAAIREKGEEDENA